MSVVGRSVGSIAVDTVVGISIGISISITLHNMDSSTRVGVVAGSLGNNRGVDDGSGVDDRGVVHQRGVVDGGVVDDGSGDGLDLNLGGLADNALHSSGLDSGHDSSTMKAVGEGEVVEAAVEEGWVSVSVSCRGSIGGGKKTDLKLVVLAIGSR